MKRTTPSMHATMLLRLHAGRRSSCWGGLARPPCCRQLVATATPPRRCLWAPSTHAGLVGQVESGQVESGGGAGVRCALPPCYPGHAHHPHEVEVRAPSPFSGVARATHSRRGAMITATQTLRDCSGLTESASSASKVWGCSTPLPRMGSSPSTTLFSNHPHSLRDHPSVQSHIVHGQSRPRSTSAATRGSGGDDPNVRLHGLVSKQDAKVGIGKRGYEWPGTLS